MNAPASTPLSVAPVPHIHRMTPLLEIAGLEKSFGALRVLDGLDLRVRPGRVTALVGPNGSGKTTLIKCVLGLVRPAAGRIVFDGEAVGRDEAYRQRIGYMPQAARFPENLTAREVLTLLRDLRGNPVATDEDLVAALRLEPELDKPLRTLSGGTRQKVNAAVAFLFRPALVILDEPTAGLDPVASSALKDKIRAAQQAGTTFLLTSHIMSELEELADDVAFLLEGGVRFYGTADELKAHGGHHRLERALAHLMTQGR